MDQIAIKPAQRVLWQVKAPGSKSLSARGLICSALANGTSELSGILSCDDTRYLVNALTGCGINCSFRENACIVDGRGGDFPIKNGSFFLGNAGTAMRFLTAVLTVSGGRYELTGTSRMRERPIGELVNALRTLGAGVKDTKGFPPVQVGPSSLAGGRVALDGSRSSQFITGLLLAGPYSADGVEIEVTGKPVSRPYIDMTCSTMEDFGCSVEVCGKPLTFRAGPGRYRARQWDVEPDASTAGYFFAAAAVTGGQVTVEGIVPGSKQGDVKLLEILKSMGCTVTSTESATTVEGGELKGVSIDAGCFPDLVPTIAAVSVFAGGRTEIRGVPHLRIKESDRIKSVASELTKLGAKVEERADGLVVHGGRKLHGAVIDPWDDHRIAMSFSVIGLRVPGVVIANPAAVDKSFPGFFKFWQSLTAKGN